ncbi:unnamed protein product, partial [Mesorhabditis spiculigera]
MHSYPWTLCNWISCLAILGLLFLATIMDRGGGDAYKSQKTRAAPKNGSNPSINATCSPVDVGWIEADYSEKYLVGYMGMHEGGNQMGNLVFELLGFAGIAKVLGRTPVIVLGSKHDYGARPQFWDNLLYYPNFYAGIRFVCDPGFNKSQHRQAGFFNRDESCVTIFSDEQDFVEDMVANDSDYSDLKSRIYLPPARTFRHQMPKHYTWAFFGTHCTHIVLTASQSTFGIIGAYLADESVKVYVSSHYPADVDPSAMFLKHWRFLDV